MVAEAIGRYGSLIIAILSLSTVDPHAQAGVEGSVLAVMVWVPASGRKVSSSESESGLRVVVPSLSRNGTTSGWLGWPLTLTSMSTKQWSLAVMSASPPSAVATSSSASPAA